jgi:hypothetical protein
LGPGVPSVSRNGSTKLQTNCTERNPRRSGSQRLPVHHRCGKTGPATAKWGTRFPSFHEQESYSDRNGRSAPWVGAIPRVSVAASRTNSARTRLEVDPFPPVEEVEQHWPQRSPSEFSTAEPPRSGTHMRLVFRRRYVGINGFPPLEGTFYTILEEQSRAGLSLWELRSAQLLPMVVKYPFGDYISSHDRDMPFMG